MTNLKLLLLILSISSLMYGCAQSSNDEASVSFGLPSAEMLSASAINRGALGTSSIPDDYRYSEIIINVSGDGGDKVFKWEVCDWCPGQREPNDIQIRDLTLTKKYLAQVILIVEPEPEFVDYSDQYSRPTEAGEEEMVIPAGVVTPSDGSINLASFQQIRSKLNRSHVISRKLSVADEDGEGDDGGGDGDIIFYGDAVFDLKKDGQGVEVAVDLIASGEDTEEIEVEGRYLRANGTSPSGTMLVKFVPPNRANARPMTIQKMAIINGWADFFAMENLSFQYWIEETGEKLQVKDKDINWNVDDLGASDQVMAVEESDVFHGGGDFGSEVDYRGFVGPGASQAVVCYDPSDQEGYGYSRHSGGVPMSDSRCVQQNYLRTVLMFDPDSDESWTDAAFGFSRLFELVENEHGYYDDFHPRYDMDGEELNFSVKFHRGMHAGLDGVDIFVFTGGNHRFEHQVYQMTDRRQGNACQLLTESIKRNGGELGTINVLKKVKVANTADSVVIGDLPFDTMFPPPPDFSGGQSEDQLIEENIPMARVLACPRKKKASNGTIYYPLAEYRFPFMDGGHHPDNHCGEGCHGGDQFLEVTSLIGGDDGGPTFAGIPYHMGTTCRYFVYTNPELEAGEAVSIGLEGDASSFDLYSGIGCGGTAQTQLNMTFQEGGNTLIFSGQFNTPSSGDVSFKIVSPTEFEYHQSPPFSASQPCCEPSGPPRPPQGLSFAKEKDGEFFRANDSVYNEDFSGVSYCMPVHIAQFSDSEGTIDTSYSDSVDVRLMVGGSEYYQVYWEPSCTTEIQNLANTADSTPANVPITSGQALIYVSLSEIGAGSDFVIDVDGVTSWASVNRTGNSPFFDNGYKVFHDYGYPHPLEEIFPLYFPFAQNDQCKSVTLGYMENQELVAAPHGNSYEVKVWNVTDGQFENVLGSDCGSAINAVMGGQMDDLGNLPVFAVNYRDLVGKQLMFKIYDQDSNFVASFDTEVEDFYSALDGTDGNDTVRLVEIVNASTGNFMPFPSFINGCMSFYYLLYNDNALTTDASDVDIQLMSDSAELYTSDDCTSGASGQTLNATILAGNSVAGPYSMDMTGAVDEIILHVVGTGQEMPENARMLNSSPDPFFDNYVFQIQPSFFEYGDALRDMSPNGFGIDDGSGDVVVASATPTGAAGLLKSLEFGGLNPMQVSAENALANPENADFLMEAWVRPSSNGVQDLIVMSGGVTEGFRFYLNYHTGMNHLTFDTKLSDTSVISAEGGTVAGDGSTWTHVAVERCGDNLHLYVDGAASSTNIGFAGINSSAAPLFIGGDGDLFNGNMAAIRYLKGACPYNGGGFSPPDRLRPVISN